MAAQLGTVPAALQGCKAPPPLASFSSTHFGACSLPIVASALAPGSEALARYLHHVYGLPAPSARLHAWNWERKDVLWLDLLPRPVRAAACTSALGGNWSVAGLAREPLAAFHAMPSPSKRVSPSACRARCCSYVTTVVGHCAHPRWLRSIKRALTYASSLSIMASLHVLVPCSGERLGEAHQLLDWPGAPLGHYV